MTILIIDPEKKILVLSSKKPLFEAVSLIKHGVVYKPKAIPRADDNPNNRACPIESLLAPKDYSHKP